MHHKVDFQKPQIPEILLGLQTTPRKKANNGQNATKISVHAATWGLIELNNTNSMFASYGVLEKALARNDVVGCATLIAATYVHLKERS